MPHLQGMLAPNEVRLAATAPCAARGMIAGGNELPVHGSPRAACMHGSLIAPFAAARSSIPSTALILRDLLNQSSKIVFRAR